jgi:AraC-like DNA-binding protein/predicted nucleotidyltransferase
LIDENWGEPLTLAQIARRCGLNRSQLSRSFRELYRCSVSEALMERRLAEARMQLISTDLPVGLIGYRSGYQNNASFSRAFSRRISAWPGQSPIMTPPKRRVAWPPTSTIRSARCFDRPSGAPTSATPRLPFPLRRRMNAHVGTKPIGSLIQPSPEAEAFYSEVLQLMVESKIPFLVSGTFALASYTGIDRPTKDVDVFAKAGDALKLLHYFKERDYDVEIVDERWLARITRGELFVDVITNMPTVTTHVTDQWFVDAPETELFGAKVRVVPPTQFIWSKIFVQDHHRYDGADVAHMILKRHDEIDWKQLLSHMELYWEVLLMALLNFRFIYPSERHLVPRWLIEELIERLEDQADVKGPGKKVCRGRIFSPRDYAIDIDQWGFSEAVGNLEEQYGE